MLETWDGSDFCKLGNVKRGPFLCSRKVVDLHVEKRWKGFCFAGMGPALNGKIKPDKDPGWLGVLEGDIRRRYPNFELVWTRFEARFG